MSPSSIIHESLKIPGYWRVHWVGYITDPPEALQTDLRFKVYLRQFDPQTNNYGEVTECLVPVGECTRIAIDDILHNGELVNKLKDVVNRKTITSILDFSNNNISFFRRNGVDNTKKPIIRPKSEYESFDDGFFISIGSPCDSHSIIIPAYEIFRFFYATSSTLAISMLKSDFLDPHTYLWDMENSARREDGQCLLWLRKNMLDADAKFLARFAYDAYALEQAQSTFLAKAAIYQSEHVKMLFSLPPVQGKISTTFSYHPIPNTERKLVTRIHQCHCKLPIKEIIWGRDNDARPAGEPTEIAKNNGAVVVVKKKGRDNKKLSDLPANSTSSPTRISDNEINERFPEFQEIPCHKTTKLRSETETNKQYKQRVFEEAVGTSVVSYTTSNSLIAKAIIQANSQLSSIAPEIITSFEKPESEEGFLKTISLLKNIRRRSLGAVNFMAVSSQVVMLKDEIINIYPAFLKSPWAFCDKKKGFPRLLLIAEVTHLEKTRYIFDIQSKGKTQHSMLIIWNSDETSIQKNALYRIMHDCVPQKSLKLINSHPHPFSSGHRFHVDDASNVDISQAEYFLNKIFSTTQKVITPN